jgi:hypothetical protein
VSEYFDIKHSPQYINLAVYLTLDFRLRQAMHAVLTHLRLIGSEGSFPLLLDLGLGEDFSPSSARLVASILISSTIAARKIAECLALNQSHKKLGIKSGYRCN